jgi:hypothetical protein
MSEYTVTRSITVDAPPDRVHALVDTFPAWTQWSPWEGLDSDLKRTYSGAESGVGARYAWEGNRKAGAGSMEIVSSTPEQVQVQVSFLKPFKSTSTSTFDLRPTGEGTAVTWTMRGRSPGGVMGLVSKVLPMEKWIGKDFERGLVALKGAAEQA